MTFKIFTDFIKPLQPKPLPKPEVKPQPAPETDSSRKSEANFVGSANRVRLEKQMQPKAPTAAAALDQISRLPKPAQNDGAAVKAYKETRAKIADNAIKNSEPPKLEDYRQSGLNGRTAEYEYRDAKGYYDSQIHQLKDISGEAKRNPDKILSPGDAVIKINDLPAPDRGNPQSIQEYNNKRAQIAKDALMYAEPPKREDFLHSGLNGATANYEYGEAKSSYDSSVRQLKTAVEFEGLNTLLTSEADKAAGDAAGRVSSYIKENSLGSLDEVNGKIASEISDLKMKYGDEAAAKMMSELYKKNPEDLFISLRLADKMSEYDRQNIGKALGDGYGYLSAQERSDFSKMVAEVTVADSFTTNANFGKSTTVGELLAYSSNTQMKTDAVRALMDKAATIKPKRFGDNGGVDVQALFKSAGIIADSAPAAERAAMLKNIVETLPKVNLPSLIKDTETKDVLAKLFMHSGADFLHLAAPDGAFVSPDVRDGIGKLMELTLFSEGVNSQRANMMEYMVKLTKDVGDASAQPPVSQSEYESTHGGWSQNDHVEVMGGLMGITYKAANNQKDAIKQDQEQQKQTVQMFTGIAFSFVPGAGKILGDIGGDGAVFLEKLGAKVVTAAWDKTTGAAQSEVENRFSALLSGDSLSNIDKALGNFRDTVYSINAILPNDEKGELDLRTKYQSAYVFYQ